MNAFAMWNSKPPAERAKLALVPVLVAAFGGVMYWRFAADSAGAAASADLAPAVSAPASKSAESPVGGKQQTGQRRRPSFDLADVIANNPFRRPLPMDADESLSEDEPDVAIESADNEVAEDVDDESQSPDVVAAEPPRPPRRWPQKVQAVFVDQRGAAAIVDSRIVHLGDVLEDGARVVEISATAVTFELP